MFQDGRPIGCSGLANWLVLSGWSQLSHVGEWPTTLSPVLYQGTSHHLPPALNNTYVTEHRLRALLRLELTLLASYVGLLRGRAEAPAMYIHTVIDLLSTRY